MRNYRLPYCTLLLSVMTLCLSLYVAYDINGSFFGKVRILQLEKYGAVTLEHVKNFELWRLFISQLIHVKQFHMLFNVISLFILGVFVERHVGFIRMFFIWFIPGTAGTLFSTFFGKPPWNFGTGASQAIMGIAAFGLLLFYKKIDTSKSLKYALIFSIVPAVVLDLIYSHYPKPGHFLGFVIGLVLGVYYIKQIENKRGKKN